MLAEHLNQFLAVGRLAHDPHSAFCADNRRESPADNRMIVGDHDADLLDVGHLPSTHAVSLDWNRLYTKPAGVVRSPEQQVKTRKTVLKTSCAPGFS